MIDFFNSGTSLVTVTFLALLLKSRHIFYGVPFLDKWRDYGLSNIFLIFALPDEAFSLHCSNSFYDGNSKDKKYTYIFTALLVFAYWVLLSTLGGVLGAIISFDSSGMDFALTALFIFILMSQLEESRSKLPALISALSAVICLIIFKPDKFIFPSLIITVIVLLAFENRIEVEE